MQELPRSQESWEAKRTEVMGTPSVQGTCQGLGKLQLILCSNKRQLLALLAQKSSEEAELCALNRSGQRRGRGSRNWVADGAERLRCWCKVLRRGQEWKDWTGRHRGGADAARNDKGTDDGMKMGSQEAARSSQRTEDYGRDR